MKKKYYEGIKLPKKELEIDPTKIWKLIDEINDRKVEYPENEFLYEWEDLN